MNLRLAGSERLAPEPGLLRARGLTTRPGAPSEPEIECIESFRSLGRGLIILSEGLPLREAAVMLMSGFALAARRAAEAGELPFMVAVV
jgi:hypothetical protein